MSSRLWKDAARKALKYGNVIRFDNGSNFYEIVTVDYNYARNAIAIVDTMERIVRSNSELFKLSVTTNGRGVPCVIKTPLGKEFVTILKVSMPSIKKAFPLHRFHPLIELFNRHADRVPMVCSMALPADVPFLNQAIAAIRQEGRSAAFRKQREIHVRWSRESTKSLLKYIDGLFIRYGRMLVVRLDLGYKSTADLGHPLLTHREVNEHRKAFFKDLRYGYWRRYCSGYERPVNLLGYAWSLEFGRTKGFHFHLLLFFDANKVKSGYALGEALGAHWCRVTSGTGTYHSCNRTSYASHGIGEIGYDDLDAILALKRDVASYLTKPDYYIRHVVSGGHTFDHGNAPKIPKVKRGRPRRSRGVRPELLIPIPWENNGQSSLLR